MDGRGLLKFFIPHLKNMLDECFHKSGFTLNDIDLIVPHTKHRSPDFSYLTKLGLPADKTREHLDRLWQLRIRLRCRWL